jgi:hypothetical protein
MDLSTLNMSNINLGTKETGKLDFALTPEQKEAMQKSIKEAYERSPEGIAKKQEEAKKAQSEADADKYLAMAQETPEQAKLREQTAARAEGKDLTSELMGKRMQEKAMKQQMAMAYARGGYQPGAVRGAQMAGAEAQGNIAAETQIAAKQEQAQNQAFYSQILAAKQDTQIRMQAAHDAMLRGDQAYADSLKQQAAQNGIQIQGIQAQMQISQAKLAQEKQLTEENRWWQLGTAALGAAGTVGSMYAMRK